MLAIRLSPEIESRLTALAAATGRTKTFYARQAILEHIDDLEDAYLAEQRLADLRAGRAKAIPIEEVIESLGLEDALSEKAIVIIEWPEHFTFRTDWPIVEIRLNHAGGDARRIAISDLNIV